MKEFGKRLLIVLSLPLWLVIHLIYLGVFIYFIGAAYLLVVAPLTYLFSGEDKIGDWWLDRFDYSLRKHCDFMTKIEKL